MTFRHIFHVKIMEYGPVGRGARRQHLCLDPPLNQAKLLYVSYCVDLRRST